MVVIPSFFSLGFGYWLVSRNLRSCSWVWHGLSVPGSCWVIFYIYLLVWMPMSLLKCKSTVYGGFLKMFSLCFIQNFHTNIYGVYFFFYQNKIWWISDCAILITCFDCFSQKHFSDLHCYFFICSPYTAFCHCYNGTGYTLDKTTQNFKF